MVFHLSEISGPARTLQPRLERLAERGTVEAIVPDEGPTAESLRPVAKVTTALSYRALTYPSGLASAAREALHLMHELAAFRRHFRRTRPDLVIVSTMMLPAALAAARLERVPTLVDVGELLADRAESSRHKALMRRALPRITARLADALVCCSDAVARQFPVGGHALVATVFPGIDRSYAGGDGAAFREYHGIPTGEFCILVVGSISPGRGQDVVVRALPRIRKAIPTARCLLVGVPHPRPRDRAYSDELRRMAQDLGVAASLRLCGAVDRMPDAYAAADVVVNPATSVKEAFGRVAFEALVAGRPVVATRSGSVPDLLSHGKDSLLVESGSPGAIADAVIRLATDPDLRARLVSAGRDRTLRDFSQERSTRGFAAVADALCV